MNNILRDNTENLNQKYTLKNFDQPPPQYNIQESEVEVSDQENNDTENLVHIMNKENYNHGKLLK